VCYNFDLCEKCEAKGTHPADHPIVKMRPDRTPVAVHTGVTCDVCKQSIYGIRYKCVTCTDYDMCEKCEATKTHAADHPLIKLRQPMDLPKKLAPLTGQCHQQKDEMKTPPINRGECPWVQAHSVRFVNDLTLHDGAVVAAGEKLTKSWSVTNSGSRAWNASTKLVFYKGHQEVFTSAKREFDVPIAAAGETVKLTVELQAPTVPGRYSTYFMLSDNKVFGPQLWIDIEVAPAVARTPTPTPVTTPTPTPSSSTPSTPTPGPIAMLRSAAANVLAAVVSSSSSSPKVPASPVPTADNANLGGASSPKKEETKAPTIAIPSITSAPIVAVAPTATPVVRPAATAPAPAKYVKELAELSTMGFNNKELNEFLLDKNNGSLQQVCNWLLENMGRG